MSAAPLPPLPGGDDTDYRPVGRSLVALLTDEHQRIDRLCRQLADPSTDGARRGQLVEVLAATVTRHLSGEHQYLYPTVRAVARNWVKNESSEPSTSRQASTQLRMSSIEVKAGSQRFRPHCG